MGIKIVPEESAGLNPHIKENIYVGRLAGIVERVLEVTKTENNVTTKEQVPRWEWVLGLRTPDGDLRFTVLTSPKATTKSKAFGFIKALQGVAPELDKEMDLDDLVGKYVNTTVKDKSRTDRTGKIQLTSEITDMMPLDKAPAEEISIEGLIEVEEEEEKTPPPPPEPPKKKGKK